MKTFYVRPARAEGYGSGDGSSYESAWNGMQAVDWDAVRAGGPATLWVCGDPQGQPGFMTIHVENSYLEAAPHPVLSRESPQPV